MSWREIAEWDWVWLGQGDHLHAVATLTNADTADTDWFGQGHTECGRNGEMQIPGLSSRLRAQRCKHCCHRTGMPQGNQSPKNVEECRPVAEARIRALARGEG